MSDVRKDIRQRSKEELRSFFVEHGAPAFHGNQVYEWLWQKAATDFAQMTNLSKVHRILLSEHFSINHTDVAKVQQSSHATLKHTVSLHDGKIVESVLIPTKTRSTACVSSQVGCSLDCTFCATAQLKRMRNLNSDEIFDQVATLNRQSLEYIDRPVSNFLCMAMG